jgi:hypothetical protein
MGMDSQRKCRLSKWTPLHRIPASEAAQMNTEKLVNGYVLTNLFYELLFLDEHGVHAHAAEWSDHEFVDQIVLRFVLPRYEGFSARIKNVVRNTHKQDH